MCPWGCPWITGWVAQILVVSAVEEAGPPPPCCVRDRALCGRSRLVTVGLVFACYSAGCRSAYVELLKTEFTVSSISRLSIIIFGSGTMNQA